MDLQTRIKEANIPQLQDLFKRVVSLNDYMSDNPEISGHEVEASKRIVALLESEGYDVQCPFDGISTSFKAIFGPQIHKRNVAILVEYDALPEIGHGCGHCVSGSISLLAGLMLRHHQQELNANIHLIGTPIEETDGAKASMVKNGVFNQYHMAIMLHMFDSNVLSPAMLAIDTTLYTFHGKSAHSSASPWEGRNAFNSAQLMFHAIDMLRQHVKPDIRMHGIIRNPGHAPNIVPEVCSLELYSRSMNREYLNEVNRMIDKCAEGAAIATGTRWEKEATSNSYDNLLTNQTGIEVLRGIYKELNLKINDESSLFFGSSDIGNVSMVCPTFHSTLQLADEGVQIHTSEFANYTKGNRAEKAIMDGAKIIALHIARVFSCSMLYEQMQAEFSAAKVTPD